MVQYILQVHSRDVNLLEDIGDIGKHTGYDLIKIHDNGNIEVESLDLSKEGGNILIKHHENYGKRLNVNDEIQIWNKNYCIGDGWYEVSEDIAEKKEFKTSQITAGNSALEIWNKIHFDAKFRNALASVSGGLIDYSVFGPNCNTWTNTVANEYIGGTNVFSGIGGREKYKASDKIITSCANAKDRDNCELLDFFSRQFFDKVGGQNVDYSKVNINLKSSNSQWICIFENCTINGEVYSFAFDTDDGNTITLSDTQNGSFIYGGDGDNHITGGNGEDKIHGGDNNDIINSGDGKDYIYGYDGLNQLNGGRGDDHIYGGKDSDFVSGGQGNDEIHTYDGDDDVDTMIGAFTTDINSIYLGRGSDKFTGGVGIDIVDGGSSEDISTNMNDIKLGAGDDIYHGGAGIDIVDGGADDDYISGGDNKDKLHGGTGSDVVFGGDGNDDIWGDSGDDYLYGGSGDDNIWAGTGRDYISAGSGINKIYCNNDQSTDRVYVSGTGVDHIYGLNKYGYFYTDSYAIATEQKGKDLHITLASGKKAILYDFMENEDEDNPTPSDNGLPFMVDPDGNILGYSIPDGGFIDTGKDIPQEEMPQDPGDDVPEPDKDTPPGRRPGEQPGGGNKPGEDNPPEDGPENPEDEDENKKDTPIDWDPKNPKPYNPKPSAGIEIPKNLINDAIRTDFIPRGDPLVIDLDGDGINLVKEDGKYFYDLGNDGVAENIDWISPSDGFLVHDENNNWKVDGVRELFGNTKIDGYDELIDFDTNGDGIINANDEKFHELKVWIDRNGNNISDSGELKTLKELGIKELQLTGKGQVTQQYDNLIQNIGKVVFEDGRINDVADVFFSTNSEQNIYTGDDVEVSEEVANMPNLKGFGKIPDLHIAAMKNESVKAVLAEISSLDKTDINSITGLTRKLIFTWGGINRNSEFSAITDKELLDVLLRFSGLEIDKETITLERTRDTLHNIYSNFENSIMRALIVQTIFSSIEGYTGEYDKDNNVILQNLNDDFGAIYNEIMQLDLTDNPKLIYNIYQILKEFSEAESVVSENFETQMIEFLNQNGFSNIASDIIADRVVITESINFPSEDTTYIVMDSGSVYNYINTSSGNDIIYGGSGINHINSGKGNDIIHGGKGNDYLSGGEGNDTYIYNLGDGKDTIINDTGGNVVSKDTIKFGEGITPQNIDVIRQGDNLILDFRNGNDVITVQDYFKNAGNTSSYVDVEFSDGTLWDYEYIRQVWRDGSHLTEIGKYINGDSLDNYIYGNSGNDTIYGNSGNDTIYAVYGDDLIIGGKGNDYLNGDYGDDTYIYNLGDGLDTISDNNGNDVIYFGKGITKHNLSFEVDGYDLIIKINNSSTQGIRIVSFTGGSNNRIENIQFYNGETLRLSEIGLNLGLYKDPNPYNRKEAQGTEFDDVINGTNNNDIINGNYGNDTLIGGYGNDNLRGGYGDDTYVWNLGDGLDKIYESDGNDKIKFGEGISFEDLTFEQDGSNLKIYIKGDKSQGIIIDYHFYYNSSRVENLEFADGSIFNLLENGLTLTQGNFNDSVNGTIYDDTIYGNGGNDQINGKDGNDILIGGKGNDNLHGDYGDDTYVWNLGDGLDKIYESSGNDKIKFGEGISFEDLTFERDGHNLKIYVNGDMSQGIIIDYHFYYNSSRVELIEFADGSTFNLLENGFTFIQTDKNDSISGTDYNDIIYGNDGDDYISSKDGNDILIGGKGNDNLHGDYGDDTYVWNLGDGLDKIYESSGNDKIKFGEGISFEDLTFERDGHNLKIYVNGDMTQGIIIDYHFYYNSSRVELIEFADGSTFNLLENGFTFIQTDKNDSISGTDYNDIIYGNDGDDYISSKDGNDIIIGGKGNDNLHGDYGDDSYVWNLGDGLDTIDESSGNDKIKFGEGISFEDLTFERDYYNLKIYINGDMTQGIIIDYHFYYNSNRVELIEFADGSTFNISDLNIEITPEVSQNIDGTLQDDTIYGSNANNNIQAKDGDDIIIGGKGNDNIYGGHDDDTYVWNLGDDLDTIYEESGNDKIKFGEGISFEDLTFEQDGNNLKIYINGDKSQGIVINNQFSSTSYRVENLEFANGSVFNLYTNGFTFIQTDKDDSVNGTDYDDTIYGNNGNDYINSKDGNDILIGGKGNDELHGGYGDDTYVWNLGDGLDKISESSGNDKIKFGEGISFEDLTFEQDGNNLKIYINGDKSQGVVISNQFSSTSYRLENLEFADGSIVCIESLDIKITGNNSDQTINGTNNNDTLMGGKGNDTLYGGEGKDTLIGGHGNDILHGGYGKDIYVWNLGDGLDTIHETQGEDKIKFGEGVSLNDLTFVQDRDNLRIIIKKDVNQGILVDGFFRYDSGKVEFIEFSDGSKSPLSGFTLTDNDNLYKYNLNSGLMTINETGGNNAIQFSSGISLNNLSFTRDDSNNLLISFSDNETDGIKITDYFKSEENKIQTLLFDDDTVFDLSNLAIENTTTEPEDKSNIIESSTNNINGTVGDDVIYSQSNGIVTVNGDDGDDIISIGNGINTVNGGNGDDIINGGNGINKLNGGYGDDIINTGNGINTVNGGYGNDIIRTGNGINTVFGGSGNDIIYTGSGINDVTGGTGNDVINGGLGNDTYIYSMGDGFDTIFETGGRDTLKFGEDISISDLSFTSSDNNLTILVKGDVASGITISDFYASDSNKVDVLEFSNGQSYDISKYNSADQLIQAMGTFGATTATTSEKMIDELNIVDNVLANSHVNKVA